MARIRQIWNIVTFRGWSFEIVSCVLSRRIVRPGECIEFLGVVRNDGLRVGTVYPIIEVSSPYNRNSIIFNSDRDCSNTEKTHARLVNVPVGGTAGFSIRWNTESSLPLGIYDFRCSLWSPPKLFQPPNPTPFKGSKRLLDRTRWAGGIEVVEALTVPPFVSKDHNEDFATISGHPSVFISYSWDSDNHKQWVLKLAEELLRYGVNVMFDRWHLHHGEETYHFMERGCRDCDKILLICTPEYVHRANARIGGVGFETVVTASLYTTAHNKRRFIPIVRAKSADSESLPTYLGGALYIDMKTPDWNAEGFSSLLRAIYDRPETPRPPLGKIPYDDS